MAMMLYIDDVQIFPPQIHAGGGYVANATNTDRLLRMGLFNQTIEAEWQKSADYLVVWADYTEIVESLQTNQYERVAYDMGKLLQCEGELLVFRRIQ